MLSLLSCVALPTQAQDAQQNALARTLFEEGVALADQADYIAAADRFSRAHSLKPTAGIAFNWASVLLELGKLLQAQDLLNGVLRDPVADPQLKTESESLLRGLAPRVPRLRVHVAGAVDAKIEVQVDLTQWPRAAWDVASPIDPGPHSVVLRHGVDLLAQNDLELTEGELRDVVLEVPEVHRPAPQMLATPVAATDDGPTHRPLYKSWVVWTAVGAVVVAGVVTGVVLATKGDAQNQTPVMGNATPGVLTW